MTWGLETTAQRSYPPAESPKTSFKPTREDIKQLYRPPYKPEAWPKRRGTIRSGNNSSDYPSHVSRLAEDSVQELLVEAK